MLNAKVNLKVFIPDLFLKKQVLLFNEQLTESCICSIHALKNLKAIIISFLNLSSLAL
jgi:hypothetical protein